VGDSGPSPPKQFSRTQQLTTTLNLHFFAGFFEWLAAALTPVCEKSNQGSLLKKHELQEL